jgi:DNA-binding CsgD family transcriptional regulator
MVQGRSMVQDSVGARLRVAVVAADPATRGPLIDALRGLPDLAVVAWSEAVHLLMILGTRVDVCLCAVPPSSEQLTRLHDLGCTVVTVPHGGDPVAAVRAATAAGPTAPLVVVRPQLAARQREVLVAYVMGSDLLPTVARRLGLGTETLKTHLRRIRAKYAEVGRPAPTRRDLYVRAVEDGLVPPPSGRH